MFTKTTFNEIETLRRIERDLAEAIEYERMNDRDYTSHFLALKKRHKIIRRAIKRLERLQNG